ncbi:hypothetical protein HOV93_35530 [Planctomycetes bacterium FF15]|uniref:Uncharacterized protein n=1 Tax=Bremerella alba TaxID=980252 RepID=A0A7V8V804_9BACT|nr:hypothetical protein [Bremerella alba]
MEKPAQFATQGAPSPLVRWEGVRFPLIDDLGTATRYPTRFFPVRTANPFYHDPQWGQKSGKLLFRTEI